MTERCLVLCVMFIVCICQCESTGDNKANPSKKQLEEIEELNEDQREKELAKSNLSK